MYILAILFLFLELTSCAVINLPNYFDGNNVNGEFLHRLRVVNIDINDLWVLRLDNDLNLEKLTTATDEERSDFNRLVAPQIRSFLLRHPATRVKKDDPLMCYDPPISTETQRSENLNSTGLDNLNSLKGDVMKIINKFAISTLSEPDSLMPETVQEVGLSLLLYFKDEFTSLVVKCGRKQWHYFIGPPSPLPSWFYTTHNSQHDGDSVYVAIPKAVRTEFCKSLLQLLQMLLGFPV
ncbi:uncharacterized protein ACR2FA_004473 [Aphomia sociella]